MLRRSFIAGAGAAPMLALGSAHAQGGWFTAAAAYSAERGGRAFLAMRNGVILAERYESPTGANIAYALGGASMALLGLMATALVDDRLIEINEPASFILGEWAGDPYKSRITLRHLLDLTAGIATGHSWYEAPTTAEALTAPARGEAGQVFIYDNAPAMAFGAAVRRRLEADAREPDASIYLQRRVLGPIGASAGWSRSADGTPALGSGASMTARSLAQVGELVRRGGIWRARRLVDEEALRNTFQGSFPTPRFGAGWWLSDALPPTDPFAASVSDMWALNAGVPRDMVMAAGRAGQRLYVIPSRAMVLVRLTDGATSTTPDTWSDATFVRLALADA